MYFKKFPKQLYDFTVITDPNWIKEEFTDLTTRVDLKIRPDDMNRLCENYRVKDGDTPEKIAASMYNNPLLHWTVLYVNGIDNYVAKWPMTSKALYDFCVEKYGENALNSTHHFEKLPEMIRIGGPEMLNRFVALGITNDFNENQRTIGKVNYEIVEVSNIEYEERENEIKRFIRVISPSYMSRFLALFDREISKIK